MCEHIKERKDYSDIDVSKHHIVPYEPYKVVPRCTDFKYGKKDSIVLRNMLDGQLEKINYEFVGSVPFDNSPGCYWYWGKIDADGPNCCLAFYFKANGELKSVSASFCAPNPSHEEFLEMIEGLDYPDQIMTRGAL